MNLQRVIKFVSLVEVPGMKPFDVRDKLARYMATIAENRSRVAERKPRYLNGLPVEEPDDEDALSYPPPPPPLRRKSRPRDALRLGRFLKKF